MTTKKPVREAVLDAATELVETSGGAGQLTLDAVAAKAGVSKGGLLHHFKSKEALLTAMVARVADEFEANRQHATQTLSAHAGDTVEHEIELISIYLDRSFAGLGVRNQGAMTLFAAAAYQPALLQPIRDYYARRTQETLEHSGSAQVTLALMLMADGLWLFDALGIPPITGDLRQQLVTTIKGWARRVIESNGSLPVGKPARVKKPVKKKIEAPRKSPAKKSRK